jgi:hypothetical protein
MGRYSKYILSILILFYCCDSASAYFENYPPYKFKNGPPKHLQDEPLIHLDYDGTEFKSGDGKVSVILTKTPNYSFLVQEGKSVLVNKKNDEPPLPTRIYWVDVDKNGLKDFIVIYNYQMVGLGGYEDMIEIFLKRENNSYQKICYNSMSSGPEDFFDLDKDGRYEVVITDFYSGDEHNYFTYNIYEFKDYKLVNADTKFKDFPKFVWITFKPNDKNTTHLTKKQKVLHTNEKNNSIKYREVK